jgi:hypothetical protein
MNPRFTVAALCVLGPLTCLAHGDNINGEATYISFSVPGAVGTYTMAINASLEVTGYYNVSPTVARGFLREADGTITTFDVAGAVWTEPESINAAGDTTGFYQLPAGVPQGFLRYADGRIITFDPPPQPVGPVEAQPISINDFDDIAGNYPVYSRPTVFIRSARGVYNADISFDRATVATAINGSGSVVGYSTDGEGSYSGFVLHPDGYRSGLTVPLPPQPGPECMAETFPDGINAAGTIAGWYYNRCNPENMGFVMSPDGVFTVFAAPGTLLASPSFDYTSTVPHWMSIDQAGDVTGSYTDTDGVQHGFVRNPYGTITSFDPPEGKQTSATSINDGGAIAGYYQYDAGGGPPVGFIRVPSSSFFVLNAPSISSAGSDSILTFDSLGHSSVFFSASHDLQGLDDIACSWHGPPSLVVSHYDYWENVSELLELDGSGKLVRRTPFGTRDGGSIALAFDDAGNFYAAQNTTLFKNGVFLTNLLPGGSEIGKMVVDSRGRLYVTQPITSKVLRVDALGNVTVFADATQGLTSPYAVAVDGNDNIYVANGSPSAPAFILKFDPSGIPSSFAANISFQRGILSMAFDLEWDGLINERDPDLYATALNAEMGQFVNAPRILKFDTTGGSSIFAAASDGLDFPISIAKCRH